MRKGWFKIEGLQAGDRSLEDQFEAVRTVLDEAAGKTVLDLGCAEGLISIEFARAGAKYVYGVDAVPDHLGVAQKLADGQGIGNAGFQLMDLNLVRPEQVTAKFDIVLVLGVLHKMQDPAPAVRWAARSADDLLVFRPKGGVKDGEVRSKHFSWNACNAWEIFREEGFALERIVHGTRQKDEQVELWRRVK